MSNRGAGNTATTGRTIRARVPHGVLTPIEPLDLPEGSEVDVTVTSTLRSVRFFGKERARLRTAGQMIGDVDLLIGATASRAA